MQNHFLTVSLAVFVSITLLYVPLIYHGRNVKDFYLLPSFKSTMNSSFSPLDAPLNFGLFIFSPRCTP